MILNCLSVFQGTRNGCDERNKLAEVLPELRAIDNLEDNVCLSLLRETSPTNKRLLVIVIRGLQILDLVQYVALDIVEIKFSCSRHRLMLGCVFLSRWSGYLYSYATSMPFKCRYTETHCTRIAGNIHPIWALAES